MRQPSQKPATSPAPALRRAVRSPRRRLQGTAAAALVAAGGLLANATPASAGEPCPSHATAPVVSWSAVEQTRAVTLCRGFDNNGARVLDVQIVDFEAGGKMRVMSDPQAGQSLPANDALYTPRRAADWFPWVRNLVSSSPAPSGLFSVTNGAPSQPGNETMMSFPQKKWNTLLSLGADTACHVIGDGVSAKRYFGLSDPRGSDRQYVYIDTYDDACQSDKATATREFSTYQGQPVNLFDATVGFHPLYGDAALVSRRTFIGTRSTDGAWTGTQDRAYLLTSDQGLTIGQARNVLTTDFRTMYNMQLGGGVNTQYMTSRYQSIDEGGGRPRYLPEVLAVYDTQ